jgi:hypothetical protein
MEDILKAALSRLDAKHGTMGKSEGQRNGIKLSLKMLMFNSAQLAHYYHNIVHEVESLYGLDETIVVGLIVQGLGDRLLKLSKEQLRQDLDALEDICEVDKNGRRK